MKSDSPPALMIPSTHCTCCLPHILHGGKERSGLSKPLPNVNSWPVLILGQKLMLSRVTRVLALSASIVFHMSKIATAVKDVPLMLQIWQMLVKKILVK